MGEGHYSGDAPEANQRLTVREAADALGISEAAVRNRIKRGTLQAEKVSGRVYVVLAGAVNHDESSGEPAGESELVAVLREQVAYLQGVIATRDRELAQRGEEIRRRDQALEREQELTAMFADRLRQLEAPREPQNEPESAEPRSGRVETPEEPSEAQRPAERRSWWRKVFGR